MADQPTAICNRALTLIGEKPIQALTDNSTPAALCQLHYEDQVLALLQGHDWNFASARATLPQLATGPVFDFPYAFQLPSDCVRVRATSLDFAVGGDGSDWQIEQDTLVARETAVSIRYTKRVSEALFPHAFSSALVYAIAAALSYPITGKPSLMESLTRLAEFKLQRAKTLDGQEGTPRQTQTTSFGRVRL